MIKVKHPIEEYNKNQEGFISNYTLKERRCYELLFTHSNILYLYQQDLKEYLPTLENYREWLEGLPESLKNTMEPLGFEKCKEGIAFKRYVKEKNDVALEEYVKQQMGPEDYLEFKKINLAL